MGTSPDEMHNTVEFYAKAPDKRLVVMNLEGTGELLQGFDGTVAWTKLGDGEAVEVTGPQLAEIRRESLFNAPLKWREIYAKVELKGKEKVGDRESYVVVLTPAADKPLTQYYDTQTFLLLRQAGTFNTPQGPMDIQVEFSDYRDIGGGLKAPFERKQSMPMGAITMKITELKNNVSIDDAKFAKPAAPAK
jgi:outer membrane lipoprotein-sorting protein